MNKSKYKIGPIIGFIITALAAFLVLLGVTRSPEVVNITTSEELAEADFLKKPCYINTFAGEIYPDKLYEPSDFENGKTVDPSDNLQYKNFNTTRFIIPVKDGEYYRINFTATSYALKVWVNGNLTIENGKVSDNPEEYVPTFFSQDLSFSAKGDTAEIVVQQANFNHVKHRNVGFYIGESKVIKTIVSLPKVRITVLCACFFLASLVSFGMYICFPENKSFIVLAILCACALVNRGTPSIASEVFPGMSWYLEHRIEIISRLLVALFFLFFCDVSFNRRINKVIKIAPYIAVGGCILFFGIAPSLVYTRYNEVAIGIVLVAMIPYAVNLLYNIIKDRKNLTYSNILVITGVFVCLFFALCNAFKYIFNLYFPFEITDGIIILALLNMIAVFYEFRDKKEALDKAELKESELKERNETALRLENIRRDFYADMSHELKTPLTVVAGNSALAARQIRMNTANEETAQRLEMVEREAVRLGRMVDGIKDMNLETESSQDKKEINVKDVLNSTAEFCEPLCGRNHNFIKVFSPDNIMVTANEDMIFHCLYNLIANATRHCNDKVIEIGCVIYDNKTEIFVKDHGDGMSAEVLSKAFERGFSGDSGSGIGLPLCRRIVEENGGEIYIKNTDGGGVTVCFTI